ncbi:17-beta-hydroxysteroid dehydrogenase 14-like isoform X1 [Mercenaria mercenaria]|uniref:17-beta-hydroxysteroid dehydrogenase 14-like isoform X1 n=1 Tax=Mercenaria mercenaria TaxID=6596 RepID=UPI00234F0105|nr:17-beta-hydroxysteroid dehydrogenase 14-like isoform X1 [Mercenaria mercenaria]
MADNQDRSGCRFSDKVAIVTGGCCGIGRGCADILAENGGTVVILDINDEVGNSLPKSGTGKLFYIHCDMQKEDDIKNAIKECIDKFGKIDCLVNNVAHHPGVGCIDDISVENFKELLNINLIANFTASKYALPYIRKTGGSIVNIASISGVIANAASPTYCASKGGVISLTKALAIDEAKHGVRVNAIAPGPVNTPMLNNVMKKAGDVEGITKAMKESNHLKRIADPREIGQACLFLAVDATFTTGEVLMCTAGNEIGYGVK